MRRFLPGLEHYAFLVHWRLSKQHVSNRIGSAFIAFRNAYRLDHSTTDQKQQRIMKRSSRAFDWIVWPVLSFVVQLIRLIGFVAALVLPAGFLRALAVPWMR